MRLLFPKLFVGMLVICQQKDYFIEMASKGKTSIVTENNIFVYCFLMK